MANRRYTFDTNILFYSLDPSDTSKHLAARQLVGLADPFRAAIILQTLGELCNACSRRRAPLLTEADSFATKAASAYQIIPTAIEDLSGAVLLQQQHQIQYWDALLLVIAMRAECSVIFSEDLQHNRIYGSIAVRNPFLMTADELNQFLS